MKTITTQELASLLSEIIRSTVVSMEYVVDDSRSKTVAGKKQIQKHVKVTHVYLNHNYQNKVRNVTGDVTFVAQEMKGKSRVCTTLVKSDKTGELMLDGKILHSQAVQVIAYYHNGVEITQVESEDKDLWTTSYYKEYEVPTYPKAGEVLSTAGRGTVSIEDDFKVIQPYLSRIVKIKIAGEVYEIKN
jgi:hypothetical protein